MGRFIRPKLKRLNAIGACAADPAGDTAQAFSFKRRYYISNWRETCFLSLLFCFIGCCAGWKFFANSCGAARTLSKVIKFSAANIPAAFYCDAGDKW